ncbi:Hypothetical predicted protein, partial [Pelobates cultripes]
GTNQINEARNTPQTKSFGHAAHTAYLHARAHQTLSTADVARNLYEKSNKADSLLANCLKKQQDNKKFSKIRNRNGEIMNSPDKIAQEFLQYYTNLYNHTESPLSTGDKAQ